MLKFITRHFNKINKFKKPDNLTTNNSFLEKSQVETEDIHKKKLDILKNEASLKDDINYNINFHDINFVNLKSNEKYKDLYLDDINYVNIENKDSFYWVPKLSHKLDNIIQNPGVYHISEFNKIWDSKTSKFLNKIPDPDNIDFDRIPPYKPPSKDNTLLDFAKKSKIKYVMSTSTISNALNQIYYLFSGFKNPNFNKLSNSYTNEPKKFMVSQRKPVTNFIKCIDKENKIYSMDSDPGIFKTPVDILLKLGKVMERQLTMGVDEFNSILLKDSQVGDFKMIDDDHHRFMNLNNNICLRSQIDCMSTVTENNIKKDIVFEIKTRSLCPIRYDLGNYENYLDYEINSFLGIHSSFEREYYDLIRGGFMKYCFQLKIGRMDGAFISYHNTKKMFGFEYVTTREIENRIFGNSYTSDIVFSSCSKLLTTITDYLLKDLENENYTYFKLGLYSDSMQDSLIILTELFETDKDYWNDNELLTPTEGMKNELDYYQKIVKKFPIIYKYELKLKVIINGVEQVNNLYQISEYDIVEIKYTINKLGICKFKEYMNFLHDAYKYESVNLDLKYSGIW